MPGKSTANFKSSAPVLFLLLAGAPASAAPALEAGSVRGSPGATVELPVYYTAGGASVAGLQLDLTFDAARLASGAPAPGASVLDHVLGSSVPQAGRARALLYSPSRGALADGSLLSLPLTIASGASAGTVELRVEGLVLSDPTAAAVGSASALAGAVTIVRAPAAGEVLSVDGQVSDGRPDRTALRLSGLGSLELRYRLSGPASGCQVRLRLVRPDGVTLGPLDLSLTEHTVRTQGLDGNWSFLVSGLGGCAGQGFHLEIRPSIAVLGLGSALLGLALLLLAVLRSRSRRSRCT
jgi:hypothetical protein